MAVRLVSWLAEGWWTRCDQAETMLIEAEIALNEQNYLDLSTYIIGASGDLVAVNGWAGLRPADRPAFGRSEAEPLLQAGSLPGGEFGELGAPRAGSGFFFEKNELARAGPSRPELARAGLSWPEPA